MTNQERIIEIIKNSASAINASVSVEYKNGTAFVDVSYNGSSRSAQLFTAIGKRGGIRVVQYTDLLDRFELFRKSDNNKRYHLWDFFRTIRLQQKMVLA